jgi:hypothetical protein
MSLRVSVVIEGIAVEKCMKLVICGSKGLTCISSRCSKKKTRSVAFTLREAGPLALNVARLGDQDVLVDYIEEP